MRLGLIRFKDGRTLPLRYSLLRKYSVHSTQNKQQLLSLVDYFGASLSGLSLSLCVCQIHSLGFVIFLFGRSLVFKSIVPFFVCNVKPKQP